MRFASFALLAALAVSCSRRPPDATPDGAVREWIDRMSAQETDPIEARSAWDLLSRGTHEALEKRADRASLIEGHHVEARDVLAPGRFALRFTPTRFTPTVQGTTATVDVAGAEPSDHATVRCVKEGKVWRVDLALPELTDLPRRPDAP
ncbi:MAG TPA: hypothetical protein VGH28_23315 [Polyangiaceae bacterium]